MHQSLIQIRDHLVQVIEKLNSDVPSEEPFGVAHNNWAMPNLSKEDLIQKAQSIIDNIEGFETEDLGEYERLIADYPRRLEHLTSQTVPNIWGGAGKAVPAYLMTLDGLRKALAPVLKIDKREEIQRKIRNATSQVKGMESRLNELQPRSANLDEMVKRIEKAYEAADRLPTDLEELSEGRSRMDKLVHEATQDQGRLMDIQEDARQISKKLNLTVEEADDILERCRTAYSAATSVGLASAFIDRSKKLSKSMWVWTLGLILALAAGGYLGTSQLSILSDLFRDNTVDTSAIALNIAVTIFSVGAPVWFAWLATKQIGQRFRLSEDYAFKAAVSSTYEGFRREAARIDTDMEAELLKSALRRLDELPLRLVEIESHGSPWHELASSNIVKQAMKSVPGFSGDVVNLARKKMGDANPTNVKSTQKDTLTGTEKE